ncbi:MAG: hypothetical protein ACRDWH_10545, partial [Acidimicrobiia bacterium]
TKILVSAALLASLGLSMVLLVDSSVLRTIMGLVGLYALWFIWTRKARSASPSIQSPTTSP